MRGLARVWLLSYTSGEVCDFGPAVDVSVCGYRVAHFVGIVGEVSVCSCCPDPSGFGHRPCETHFSRRSGLRLGDGAVSRARHPAVILPGDGHYCEGHCHLSTSTRHPCFIYLSDSMSFLVHHVHVCSDLCFPSACSLHLESLSTFDIH